MTRRSRTSIVASPILVGTVTVLVSIVAMFLSYNANTGLPFVPTYDLTATVPDAAGLVRGNEVRIGGKRVGIVSGIDAGPDDSGAPVAVLELKLEQRAGPLLDDTLARVRPRSTLGLKYLELTPGERGAEIPAAGEVPPENGLPTVELDEALNTFDSATRRATQRVLDEAATGLAGRGADFNALLEEAPPLLRRFDRVAANLSDRRTDLRGFLRGVDVAVSELALSAVRLGPLVEAADTTAGAFANTRAELAEGIEELPPTESVATSALAASRPVLRDAAILAREIRPGTRVLDTAGERLHEALRVGIPVLRRTTALSGRLEDTLESVRELSSDPLTSTTLERLLATVNSAKPTVDFLAPFQIRCNYLGLWTRNTSSTISEGDNAGTWFRTLVVVDVPQMLPSAAPAADLHVNPYPNTAAPGQEAECEAGNEPYLGGQRIGNVPGNQGQTTDPTTPPPGTPQP